MSVMLTGGFFYVLMMQAGSMDQLFIKLWSYLMRDRQVTVEIRLFRLICLSNSLLSILVIIPINLLQDLSPHLNQTLACYGAATLFLYRYSCRGRHYIKSFYCLTLLVLNLAWFLNGGSSGAVSYFFFVTVLYALMFFRGPTRQLMFVLLLFDEVLLLLLEHYYPFLVLPYRSEQDRLMDLASSFALSAIATALVFWVVVTSLEHELEERKRVERSLIENEKTLRMLMDFMPSAVWSLAQDGSVEYLNRCFTEKFGYTLEEVGTLDQWARRAYPDDGYRRSHLSARSSAIEAARSRGKAVPLSEAKIVCKDGSIRHFIVNTQFILGRTIEIFTDITERELMHDQMLKVQKLESLGVLAGGIAHDFNNILTGIMGNISFAKMSLDDSHDARSMLNRAEKASLRAVDLSKQLLVFAKGGKPVKKTVSLQQVLQEACSLGLSGTIVKGVIEIPHPLNSVEADEGQMNQSFHNIIINAVQSMPAGGRLTVQGENVVMQSGNSCALPAGDYVKFCFSDEGCGIPQGELKKIFDPYFTTKQKGTGLGLASTYAIIRNHGGQISVDSSVGVGTTFTLYLPSLGTIVADAPCPEVRADLACKGCGSILVMDDDEMIRELASVTLEFFGYKVQACSNGEEAIALYAAAKEGGKPYCLVIMDLTIPGGMGGVDAARGILALDPEAKLIVSSGYSDDPVMSDYREYGFLAALEKPYHAEDIAEMLVTVSRGTAIPESATCSGPTSSGPTRSGSACSG